MRLSIKCLSVPFLLSAFNTSYILLADNINAQTECRIAILLFVFVFLTIVCTDIALRYWAGKNVVWHSSTSLGLTVREYVVFVAYILLIVNFASIFTTDILLLRQTDITDIVKANLVTVPIIFLYYSLLKERNRNIISTDASGIDTTRTSKSHIYLKSSDGTVKRIFLDDILFIQSMEKHVIIHSAAAKETVAVTTKKILSMLPESMFVQTHRSYIVNRNRICAISGNDVIVSGAVIPIGRSFRNVLYPKSQI